MTTPVYMQIRRATFTPSRTDDLRPGVAEHIGKTYEWRGAWIVSEDDGGPYVGQTVWTAEDVEPYFGWVPDEDLTPA